MTERFEKLIALKLLQNPELHWELFGAVLLYLAEVELDHEMGWLAADQSDRRRLLHDDVMIRRWR